MNFAQNSFSNNYTKSLLLVILHRDPFDDFPESALFSSFAIAIAGRRNGWAVAVKVYMEPGVVGGSTGHCRLVRCGAGEDPKMPITVVDGPETGGV